MKNVELYIEDKRVDLFGNEGFTLTFSIAEISEIGKKSSSFSKEITLPANDNNNRVFTSLFDVTVEGGFNPISRKRAVLFVDSVPLMQGYFKLNSINIKDNEYVTYRGVLFEEQTNFINAIEGFNLDNLVIPLTGTTQVIKAPYTEEATLSYASVNGAFLAKINGVDAYKAMTYSGLSFSTGTWGTSATKNRTAALPSGMIWDPATVTSYKATANQVLQLTVVLAVQSINIITRRNMKFKYSVVKSDYNTPATGAFTDVEYLAGDINISVLGTVQFTVNVPLFTNDEVRIELFETTGNDFIILNSSITGKVYTGTVQTISGMTINATKIINVTENIENSDQGIVTFPIIDYGERYQFYNFNLLNIFQIKNTMFANVDSMRPWVFVKHVWDAIFEQAGFTYKSNFLNSANFKKMIIGGGTNDDDLSTLVYSSYYNTSRPNAIMFTSNTNDVQNLNSNNQVYEYFYNQQHMSNAKIDFGTNASKYFINDVLIDQYYTYNPSKKFTNVKAHTVEYYSSGAIEYYYGYNLPYADDYGVFPTAAVDAKYRIHAKLSFTSHPGYNASNPSTTYDYPTTHILQIQKLRIGSYKYFPTSSTAPEYDKWEVIKETRVKRVKNFNVQSHVLEINETLSLNKGDMIRIVIIADANREGYPTNASFNQIVNYITIDPDQEDTFFKFYRYGSLNGETITNAATLLPKAFKQKDFILELAKMFNLYFEVDKENPRCLLIEPRDSYYESGRILNYERKIDYSKEFEISILSHDYARNQIFKYKDDNKDYLSTEYAKIAANELIFGSYNFESLNEYNFDESKLELKFAPSYMQQVSDPRIKMTKIHDPKLYDTESTVAPKPNYKITPRIMFYKKVSLNFDDFKILLFNLAVANYIPLFSGANNTPNQSLSFVMTDYGYAGHLNDYTTPTFDLNWYTDFDYLPGTTATDNNLFNIFYKNEMIELTDQSARKVECYVDLRPYDIINLRFNDVYYFKKDYWRLIEIKDYNTSSDISQTTKCTFIKVVRAQTNELIDYGAFGYGGLAGGTAGGLTGTPLDQVPLIGIGGGTVVNDGISWGIVDRINRDKNNLQYQINLTDTPISMPLDDIMLPIIDRNISDIQIIKDITISIQDNVDVQVEQLGGGDIIYFNSTGYTPGDTVEVTSTDKRMIIETDVATYTETPSEIELPAITTDLYDGYSFEIYPDLTKGAAFAINYLDIDDNLVVLYSVDEPLIIQNTEVGGYSPAKFVYWAGTGKYVKIV